MKRTFKAADGEVITVDDEVTLLGPAPDLSGCSTPAKMDPRYAHIVSFHQPAFRAGAPKMPSGYGITEADIDAWRRDLQAWFERERSRRRKL